MVVKKRGLGRGLDALLGGDTRANAPVAGEALASLPVEWIRPGKYQPRKQMDEEALAELAASIKAQGLMQPIVVRSVGNERYEIIAGERRWRASQLAGLDKIPAVVKDVGDEAAVAMSLIENIQREDLNPMEEAQALQRLIQDFELTHQEVADAVGKSRATVTNCLRLNNLAKGVAALLAEGEIEMGHARALLSLPDENQLAAAREIIGGDLNVRQAEALVRRLGSQKSEKQPPKVDSDTRHLEQRLAAKLGQPVTIQHRASGKGKVMIGYGSLDELDGILGHFGELDS